MRQLLLWLLLPLTFAHAELSDDIDRKVGQYFRANGPGAAILISRNGEPILMKGYGLANIRAGTPITPDSLFDLASVSKHFTAMAIMVLMERGKLQLDQPVTTCLPDFRVPVVGRPITLLDLLHHTSGLRDYTVDFRGSNREFAELTTETHLDWLNGTEPRSGPGEKFQYDNSNYVLLSLIVERVSGQRFATFVKEQLFWKADMLKSRVYDGTNPPPSRTVTGYIRKRSGVERSSWLTDVTGDGNVYTSVRELARWDYALRKHLLVRRATQDAAWTNGQLDNGEAIRDEYGAGYGFGWGIDTRTLVSHDGSWFGTSTYIVLDLRTGTTVAVLSNDENADVYSLGESIRRLVDR